jgi:rare lipoprotein A (peptidoglycan hydrolase)
MADRSLGNAQIVPAARPVSSFITPGQIQAAAPAKPSGIVLANNSAGLVATAGRPNVPGYNPGQQLAEALSNFSTSLTKTVQMGVELYATDQYQQGQNEVMKASMLAERQMDQSSVDYATANRQLAQKDPIAAMAMDQTNPFRHAGRQNALSQLAASEINTAMTTSYRSRAGDLVLKDPTDPSINQVKADAINSVVQRYGLDETSPGFAKHFLPAMNRAWERVTAQHVQDRNDYLKDTVWRTAGAQLANGIRQARADGRDLGQALIMGGSFLDQEAVRLGLPGEATNMKVKAIQLAQQLLADSPELADKLANIPVGPPDEQGYRPTAAQLYPLELMEADDKYGEMRRRAQERELAPIREALSDEIANIGLTMEDGPGKLEAIQGILNKPEYQRLPFADKLEAIGKANKLGEEVLGQGYDPTAAGNFIGNLDKAFGFGGKRDIKAAEAALQEALQRTAPEDRAALIQKFTDWKNKQQKQPWELINPAINNAIKANLEQRYPELGTAALRGASNVEGILQWGDAKSKESSAAQLSIYRSAVLAALDEKRTKFGRDLTDAEAQAAIDKAIYDVNTRIQKDEAFKNRLFPAVPGATPDKPPPAPAGTKPSPVQGFRNPGTLDTLPDRDTRLQNWRSQPVLDFQGTAGLTGQILNGGDFPAAFRRAAKDAGTTPEQLLIQQVDFYKNGLQLSPQQRNQILKRGNQAQALDDNRQARGTFGGSLASAAGWMFDAVMGVRPAMASGNREIDLMRMYGGGGQWDRGPAVAASHGETGSGYTIPGAKDASGRPVVLSRGGANSLAAMVAASGGQVKYSDIASAQRSKAKNAAVGGVSGSQHLGGNALDIHGSSIAWIRKHGAKYGWYVNDYDGTHGGHVEFRGGGSARPSATARSGGGMTGLATYYTGSGGSDGVAGGPTANGERYNPNAMTAAVQWSLRGKYLNKWVTVEDMDTGKTVKVWVNDVGQMGGSRLDINRQDPRVIDLSPAAFKKLFGSTSRGVGRIRIIGS